MGNAGNAGAAGGAGGAGGAVMRRYRRVLVLLAAGMLVPALGPVHPALLAVLLIVAACAASPAVAAGYAVAERLVPPARLVEGLGYAGAALNLGLAAGTALAGLVADVAGGRGVFTLGSAIGALGVLAAFAVPAAPSSRDLGRLPRR
jgi:predicted MFS family arabinose efflux permease